MKTQSFQRRDLAVGLFAAGAIAFARPARRFRETRFGRIAYRERGRGPHAAVFLHGFPLNSYQWRDAMALLAPYRRCLAPDFLGLGNTEVAKGQSVAPDAQAEMILAFLDSLHVDRADFIANDSGGAVAQLILANAPSRVRTLLLTNCDTEPDCPPAALAPVIDLARKGRFAQEWLAPWLADKRLARSDMGIGGMCYTNPQHPTDAAIKEYFAPLTATKRGQDMTNAYALALEANALAGIKSKLQQVQTPVRIVWGKADPIFAANSPAYLDSLFPQSRGVRILEDRKLFWPEELPEVIAREAKGLWDASSNVAAS